MSNIDVNIFLLVYVGLAGGVLSGFAGVGGAVIVMPALIILGVPASFAVGTSLAWVTGNAIIGAFRHRKLGNVDIKLGTIMVLAVMGGVEVGVRIINRIRDAGLADEVVLSISICILAIVGSYTFSESIRRKRHLDTMEGGGALTQAMETMVIPQKLQSINVPPVLKFAKSQVSISLWIILAVGFTIGIIVGVMGVGGGFIVVPALVYLFGIPTFVAVGTDLFQIIFSAAYGSIRHAMSGNVIILVSLILLVASSIGLQFGVLVTKYVRGVAVRFILGITILIIATGALLKLLSILVNEFAPLLQTSSLVVTFSSAGLSVMMIIVLYIMALRYRRGQRVPEFVKALLKR
ncbi:MAG: sulfite exporter TauE/SafE family protein [Dehalococcoidales bacterium]